MADIPAVPEPPEEEVFEFLDELREISERHCSAAGISGPFYVDVTTVGRTRVHD